MRIARATALDPVTAGTGGASAAAARSPQRDAYEADTDRRIADRRRHAADARRWALRQHAKNFNFGLPRVYDSGAWRAVLGEPSPTGRLTRYEPPFHYMPRRGR